jgi:hypothetical protein
LSLDWLAVALLTRFMSRDVSLGARVTHTTKKKSNFLLVSGTQTVTRHGKNKEAMTIHTNTLRFLA